MACLAHDDWPSDEEEFLTALKERVHPLGGPESALAAPARLAARALAAAFREVVQPLLRALGFMTMQTLG